MALLEAAVVLTLNEVVPVPPEAIARVAGLNEQVGRLWAPAGELVKAHVRFIAWAYALIVWFWTDIVIGPVYGT